MQAEQDLWARTDDKAKAKEGLYAKDHKGQNMMYKEQKGNYVRWLLDGAEAMYEMFDAFCQATDFIYITGMNFALGIDLVRADDYSNVANNSKYKDIINDVRNKNRKWKLKNVDTVPLVSLLAVQADKGVKVRIVIFHPDGEQVKSADGGESGSGAGWEDAFKIVRELASNIDIRLAMWGNRYQGHEAGAHHQKSAVVATQKGLIGFCGGVDLAFARWTRSTHSLWDPKNPLDVWSSKANGHRTVEERFMIGGQKSWIDPDRVMGEWDTLKGEYVCGLTGTLVKQCAEGSQVLWHDVHSKVVGPAAFQLAFNFAERYMDAETNYHYKFPAKTDIMNEIKPFVNQSGVSPSLLSSDGAQGLESYSKEPVYAQIVRSYTKKIGDPDYSIWDAYRNLFGKAKKNIYIESQYAFEDGEVLKVLIENLKRDFKNKKELKVIVVAPVMPDSYDPDIINNLGKLLKASSFGSGYLPTDSPQPRAAAFSLISFDGERSKRVPIYVHAKIAVVDDEWAIVGSANLDRPGMGGATTTIQPRGSSEMCILVHGRDQALVLRNMLVKEHLGDKAPSNPDDFNAIFNAFVNVASNNGKISDGKQPKAGQVVFHRVYPS